jgi:hypothetical protein
MQTPVSTTLAVDLLNINVTSADVVCVDLLQMKMLFCSIDESVLRSQPVLPVLKSIVPAATGSLLTTLVFVVLSASAVELPWCNLL